MADLSDQVANALSDNPQDLAAPVEDKIKVGDNEYTQDQLNRLVGLGKIAEDLETKWNTKIDKVYPAYTQATNKLKEYEPKITEYEKLKQQQSQAAAVPQDQQILEAKKVLRDQLGVLTRDDLAELGIITKQDYGSYYKQERMAEKLLDDCSGLEKDLDGKDGRPAFKTDEVLQYMATMNIPNPKVAYNLMYETQLNEWNANELGKAKKNAPLTVNNSSAGATRQPQQVKVTKDNIGELVSQMLEGSE